MAKTKKGSSESINSKLQLVMKSGKASLGYKRALSDVRSGRGRVRYVDRKFHYSIEFGSFHQTLQKLRAAKLVVISSNCPPLRKSEMEYNAMLAKCGVHHYLGDTRELGTACGKLFRISCMSITNPGDSDIIKSRE
ncbi:ribosomal protein RPL30 [Cardiosporidium cionae]|uniref:Ribosomal protein RPL30 n=1 Tax=Cardiosporidium cionae TaxID=476202 RepID=A0ABQ7J928_9APIC|nr:ribosomal protein RPL30 [Cardiosporidium cionae]|eukprot:KAF8820459.1 ribosomal protein RPL30 [Cardiosporidium cionae]